PAVGRRLTDSGGTVLQIVGVVGDTKYLTVADAPPPLVYYPVAQQYLTRMTLIVRTALPSERLGETGGGGLRPLVLAVVGLYGAIAYLVARRTREIGVRIALGATPDRVLALVVGQGLWIAGAGIAAGVVCAALVGRPAPLALYRIVPLDRST